MNPAVGVGEQAETAEGGLALEAAGQIVGQGAALQRGAQHELAGMRTKGSPSAACTRLVSSSLLLGRVDVGVAGAVEDTKEVVQAYVYARRLHQCVVERVDAQPPAGDLGADVTIREQHPTSV